MDWSHKLLFTAFLILAAAIDGTKGHAMVTGTVFCDQCKDGQISLFDYPAQGVKVAVTCTGTNGQIIMSREETTNLFGNYAMRFDGTPDLSNCYAQVSGIGQGSTDCGAPGGPAQKVTLMLRMFNIETYTVDSLLSQPVKPMSSCPKSANPVPAPVTPARPPPATVAPITRSPPPFKLPPMPRLPPLPPLPRLPGIPPLPFVELSACPYQNWTMPKYKCYWRALNPEAKVAVVFGPLAGRRYGTDMTLWQALQGRGDPYKTLLREGTAALLNSFSSLQFPYNAVSVHVHMNSALVGSPRNVLITALRFLRANSGNGKATCKFNPCK